MAYDDLFNSQSPRDKQDGRTLGNIDPKNPNFTGRFAELSELRRILSRERQLAVITPVQGRAGLGATALAIHYAHVFANEYEGGCWQVQCRDRQDPLSAVSPELKIKFNPSHRCFLLLNDVDRPELLDLGQIKRVLCGDARADWLDVIATTRVEETSPSAASERAILRVAELPEADAVALIESFQPNRKFVREDDRAVAREIVNLLGGFTLAIEVAAAHLGYFGGEVSFVQFVRRLRDEGLAIERAGSEKAKRLDENHLIAALRPTVKRLAKAEVRVLFNAALSSSEQIILPEFKSFMEPELLELIRDSPYFYSPVWSILSRRFVDLRLWQRTSAEDDNGEPLVIRMHPLLQVSVMYIVRAMYLESAGLTLAARPPRVEKLEIPRGGGALSGKPAALPRRAPAAPKPLDDNVMFTVYRRKTVAPNKWYPLLAFAHLSERRADARADEPDPVAEVKRQAEMVLGKSVADYKQSAQDSTASIPRSGELTFKPYAEGVEFNPSSRSFRWEESVHREEFKMRAAAELDGQTTRGWLRIYLGPLIIAQVNLTFMVDSKVASEPVRPDETKSARPSRKIFASYSHKDKPIVEHIEKIVSEAHLGFEYLRDATKLRSGEVWNDELMRMIDGADIFQLFWSTNSMGSKYVRQEYEYALSRSVPDFVRPVYWEKPFPERPDEGLPPDELRCLHFEEMTIADTTRLLPPPIRYGRAVATLSPGDMSETMRFERSAPELAPPRAGSGDRETLSFDPDDLEEVRSDTRYDWKPDDEVLSKRFPTGAFESTDAPLLQSAPLAKSDSTWHDYSPMRPASGRRSALKIISVAAMVVPIILFAPLLLMTMMSTASSGMAATGGAPLLLLFVLGGALLFVAGLVLFILQRNR